MSCTAEKVVATAISEVGYKETGNNITKYSAYFDKNYPNFYNTKKQGAEYCDIFVDYCVMVNCDSEQEAEYVLCQPAKSCGAGCSFSYDYYKKAGRTGSEPRLGAQIFLNTSKKSCAHTGIVVGITEDSVNTVEGNTENMVKRHTYKKNSSKIFGYGYPRYTEPASAPAPVTTPEPAPAPEPTPTPPAEPVKTTTTYRVKTFNPGKSLNLRTKPVINPRNIVTSIKDGTHIEVISISDGWAKCEYKGRTVYCTSNRLQKV